MKNINSRLLKQIATALLEDLNLVGAEVGIHLVGAGEMERVNREFLKHEGSTDVITFNYSNSKSKSKNSELIGEIFICVDDAVLQSKQFKTTWQAEVVRYLVHGVLHLLGHDDLLAAVRRKMKREENRLVRRLRKRFSLAQLARPAKLGA
jgi:probable rRNA maturation factor